ncbi:1-deoxy-D-xylulose-5-phosphate reductoisomerase, partial [Nocardia salmonicida]
GWPDRIPGAAAACDFGTASTWTFEPVDDEVFPAVRLARQAGEAGGSVTAVYNAANEVAVQAFLDGKITFPAIVRTVTRAVEAADRWHAEPDTLDDVLAADRWAREYAAEIIAAKTTP